MTDPATSAVDVVRRMLALGSGEPTRFICSTLIAQAFQSVRYPILPRIEKISGHMRAMSEHSRAEILHIRHHSLFTPRDFDISPYFQIVKPTIEHGFDHRTLVWDDACHLEARTALTLDEARVSTTVNITGK